MSNRMSLFWALIITILTFILEVVGGIASNSLALLSDAGHLLTDASALGLALLAAIFSSKKATKEKTFGFYRLEILSALLNGTFLSLISIYIFYQAYQRFMNPSQIQSGIMLIITLIGLLANGISALILAKNSNENLNSKGAYLHVMSDLFSSFAVLIGGIIIYFTHFYFVDAILGGLIGILILRGAVNLINESVNILLEAAPAGISVDEVAQTIKSVRGVESLHDLHIWSITSGLIAISAHIIIKEGQVENASDILKEINKILKGEYNISHSTFQTECKTCPEGLICGLGLIEREKHGHH